MIPNLKVDIIYYKTQSDFELEFNLSGYCRMRIFKSSAETPAELLDCLARDLDRSRIVLVVTDVLSNDCGVKTISDAVGLDLVSVDKEAFKIQTAEEIFVPKNALPLVSKSGAYGGCIAESNIQSIIMITDNRALRHDIMKSLVHQYIFDIAQVEAYKQRQRIDETTEEAISEIKSTSADDSLKEDAPVKEIEHSDISNSIFSAPGTNLVLNPTQEDTSEEEFEEDYSEPSSKNRSGSDITLLIIVILLLLGFGVLAYFFIYLPLSSGGISLSDADNGLAKAIEAWLFN